MMTLIVLLAASLNGVTPQKTYPMPSEAVLNQQLQDKGLDHFNEKTGIAQKLGGTEKLTRDVFIQLELAIDDYSKHLKGSGMPPIVAETTLRAISMSKPMILEALLQEHPEALEELKKFTIETSSENDPQELRGSHKYQ